MPDLHDAGQYTRVKQVSKTWDSSNDAGERRRTGAYFEADWKS
jgi:hypothetical protein